MAKSKLIRIEVLISKSLIDSNTSHDEFVSINNVLEECEEMKEKFNNLRSPTKRSLTVRASLPKIFSLFIKQCYHIV